MNDTLKIIHEKVLVELKPSSFLDYKVFLSSLFSTMKGLDTGYSYYQFAEDMGFARTNIMYQYMAGQRKMSSKAAEQISKHLQLKGSEKKYFQLLAEYCNTSSTRKRDDLFKALLEIKQSKLEDTYDKDILTYLSEWYHPVIRELIGLESTPNKPADLADMIQPRVRPEQVKKSIDLLKRIGLVEEDETGMLTQTSKNIATGHRIRGMAIKSYHQAMIERAKDSLSTVKGSERNISAMTIAIDEKNYELVRSLIHEFNEKVFSLSQDIESQDRIYQFNVQFFPFVTPQDKGTKK
ncbi:TIGR02147 family protein [Pseudobacteriovorax antillogorgiicola]|uniref:TIGR02147 family protein n=1 Tax=Pseudobacteriovorax antillogorgiicola TaxID=1513793 RepID=A0A1Y6BAL7_9BACT|nr:TIGR02147 family protein [Pseudobacteriovorax antillogorgiicola]TCS57503.1 uncharacterized protein (TIGR02147 family) [Pseudobacteriovorax antillogorgiicola]SMF00316.1 TIGR02147 family protein [Pseudobacteriovorax antillogorgiicola]